MFHGQCEATYGGSKEPLDEVLYNLAFKDVKEGFFIEAGAHDGVFLSTCLFFEESGWKGLNVEPQLSNFKKLIINRPNSINVNAALSNFNGLASFSEAAWDGGGFSHLSVEASESPTVEMYEVEVVTYRDLIADLGIKKVDLFVLDVEAHELKVIEGMQGSDVWPGIFCIEHPYVGLENLTRALSDKYNLVYSDRQNGIFKLA